MGPVVPALAPLCHSLGYMRIHILLQVILPEAITKKKGHSADVFGCGPNFRVVVLFGGIKNTSGTTLLLLGQK